jgi:hypothetical protein
MAGDDTSGSAPSDRPVDRLQGVTDTQLLAAWRKAAARLATARRAYASEYLRAKIRKESDGTAHQIATEATDAETTVLEADLDIIKAIYYRRGRTP